MKFEVSFKDGTAEEIDLPKKLPWKVGKKCRRKLKSKVKGNQERQEIEMDNPLDKLTAIQEVLVEELLGDKVDTDKISTETVDRLGDEYWSQIQKKGE